VALEACVQARNEGRDPAREGNEIIKAQRKPESAIYVWDFKRMCITRPISAAHRLWSFFPLQHLQPPAFF
jgi:hypothetical protein